MTTLAPPSHGHPHSPLELKSSSQSKTPTVMRHGVDRSATMIVSNQETTAHNISRSPSERVTLLPAHQMFKVKTLGQPLRLLVHPERPSSREFSRVPCTLTFLPLCSANIKPTTTIELTTSIIPSAVGAAGNAGANPFASNGALTMRHASTPAMVLATLAAIFVISL